MKKKCSGVGGFLNNRSNVGKWKRFSYFSKREDLVSDKNTYVHIHEL